MGGRAIAVLAVLYVLGTLLLPLMRFSSRSGSPAAGPIAAEGVPPTPHFDTAIAQLRSQGFVVVAGPAPRQGATVRPRASPFAIPKAGWSS